jgi:hypothetical protein
MLGSRKGDLGKKPGKWQRFSLIYCIGISKYFPKPCFQK